MRMQTPIVYNTIARPFKISKCWLKLINKCNDNWSHKVHVYAVKHDLAINKP